MSYLLFVVYFFVLSWMLTKFAIIKKAALGNQLIITLFAIKVLAGLAIGYISYNWLTIHNDYWDNNTGGMEEYNILLKNPAAYFSNLFFSPYDNKYGGFFSGASNFWNDLRNNLVLKLVSIFNFLSKGNYYINSLFFNFLVFFGHVILYRLFKLIFVDKKWAILIGTFLLPSFLYFSSGIHRDGLVFCFLAFAFYSLYQIFGLQKIKLKYVVCILISLLFLLLLRNVVIIALLPAMAAFIICKFLKYHPYKIFGIVYLAAAILFFTVSKFTPINPLKSIIEKQESFLALGTASTQIPIHKLDTTTKSFLQSAPQAMGHVLFRPIIGEMPKTLIPFEVELLFYWCCLLFFLIKIDKRVLQKPNPFILFCLAFVLLSFLFIGYVTPNLGTIVRYRSIYLPFIITPLLCSINLNYFLLKLNINKK